IHMRKWFSLMAVAALAAAGCNKSPEGGSTGTSGTFKLVAPTLSTTIRQGDTKTVDLSIERGKEFKHYVKLSATAPDKIEAKLNKDVVKAGDPKEFTLSVSPAKDAPVGDHVVKVTGTPEGGGQAATVEVKIKVD